MPASAKSLSISAIVAVALSVVAGGCANEETIDTTKICQQRLDDYATQLNAVVAAHLSCTSDADCVIGDNDLECHLACGVIVNRQGADALKQLIEAVTPNTCHGDGIDCPVNWAPPCVGLVAGCVSGTCAFKL
jgi:hypothetical protein